MVHKYRDDRGKLIDQEEAFNTGVVNWNTDGVNKIYSEHIQQQIG